MLLTSSPSASGEADPQDRIPRAAEAAQESKPVSGLDPAEAEQREETRQQALVAAKRSPRGLHIPKLVRTHQRRRLRANEVPGDAAERAQQFVREYRRRRPSPTSKAEAVAAAQVARRPSGHRRAPAQAPTRSRGSRRTATRSRSSGDDSGGSGSDPDDEGPRKAPCAHCGAATYRRENLNGHLPPLCARCGDRLQVARRDPDGDGGFMLRALAHRFPAGEGDR